jgi:hypothetical protein
MYLEDLRPGERFALAGMPERTGTLVSLSPGAALVRYDGGKRVSLVDARTDQAVTFDSPNRPVTVSRTTEVVRAS